MQKDSAALGRQIEEALAQHGKALSASDLARSIGEPLSRVSYAMLRLEHLGRIEGAGERQNGKSIKRFYRAK